MKPKKELNAQQRKMLDEVYMHQFDTIARKQSDQRMEDRKKLEYETVKKELAKEPLKTLLKKLNDAFESQERNAEYLKEHGLKVDSKLYKPEIKTTRRSSYDDVLPHPVMEKFDKETREIEIDLSNKRKEIRARIYGLSTTFEEVDAEIKNYINGISK